MADQDTNIDIDQKDDDQVVDRGDELDTSKAKSPLDDAGKGEEEEQGDKLGDKLGDDKGEEEEGEETPEEKAEREAQEAEEAKKKRVRIPKSRFDEAQAKARAREQALLEEIERLKGDKQQTDTQKEIAAKKDKIEELQDKYEDLILDGKKEEARKVRKEVDALREDLVEFQTTVKSDAARKAAVEELTYNAQLAGLEAKYPALNPDHDDFDEDATNEVATLLNAFVKAGTSRATALAKAVKYVMGEPVKPKDEKDEEARRLAQQRAADARKKAAEADKKQPASTNKVGIDSDKAGGGAEGSIDVMRLSQEKFAKLDEETKAKLRGDEI